MTTRGSRKRWEMGGNGSPAIVQKPELGYTKVSQTLNPYLQENQLSKARLPPTFKADKRNRHVRQCPSPRRFLWNPRKRPTLEWHRDRLGVLRPVRPVGGMEDLTSQKR